ncbi:disulfide bond formation protein DsbD [Vibrio cholerae]|nr:disulfide bond formation protein DsbD [Vibrio cholerae]MDV2337348.1 disulfide bond formation protein DsbD [Vibrio cholerae]MDV2362420.1 disulfide bond formation protein DsbD [Vibrio cholerae]
MLCLSLVVMRCQPLRRALCLIHKNQQVVIFDSFGISFRFCRQFNIVRRCLTKWQCIWRCKFGVIASLGF